MAKNNYLNVLLISGSGVIGGLINYAYHPIMLNFLTIEEFGVFGSLVGMFNILGIITAGLILFLNKEVSKNIGNKSRIKFIFYESLKILSLLSFVIFFVYLLFGGFIANFLKIDEIFLVYIVGLGIILGFINVSEHSVLRGLKKFEFISLLAVISPIFKLLFGVLLVFLGFKIYGAVIGFIIGGLLSVFISILYLFKHFKNIKKTGNTKDLVNDFVDNKKDIFNFFFISFFFAVLMNIDLILVKNLFDSTTAGIYAGVSVLAKFLIFLLLSIETVYYGQIMEYDKNKVPSYLIINPIILITIASILALLFNYFFGLFILELLKGELANYINIFLLILVYYSFLAFISFFSKILIAWNKYLVNYIMGFLTLLLFVLVYSFGDTIENFVYIFIFIGVLGTIITGILFYREYNKRDKLYNS